MKVSERVLDPRPRPIKGDVDEPFRRSVASLAEQLTARPAAPRPDFDDGQTAPKPRVVRIHAADGPSTGRSLIWAGGFSLGAVAGAAAIYAFLTEHSPEIALASQPPPASTAASPAPLETAPPPALPASPAAEAVVVAAPAPSPDPAPTIPRPDPPSSEPAGPLARYEIMELQSHLKELGMNPGPLDGVAGGQTKAAIKRYEAANERPQTGTADRTLLKTLREATRSR